MSELMIDLIDAHAHLWERVQQQIDKHCLPQSILLVGPRHTNIHQFTDRLMALLICEAESKPCKKCRACHLLLEGLHPDINYINQEPPGSAIKIEQIRGLQQDIYQTPQRGQHRFIIIAPAEKMNISAANALLKILEEPPSHTTFLLIAEQVSSIPPTILSRCQTYIFSDHTKLAQNFEYLDVGHYYSEVSARGVLFKQTSELVAALCDLMKEHSSPCTIAAKYTTYAFDDLLWLLYLVTAQAIHYQVTATEHVKLKKLAEFSLLVRPGVLFRQIDNINAIMKKLNHNINMNQTLVLEDLLLGYLSND